MAASDAASDTSSPVPQLHRRLTGWEELERSCAELDQNNVRITNLDITHMLCHSDDADDESDDAFRTETAAAAASATTAAGAHPASTAPAAAAAASAACAVVSGPVLIPDRVKGPAHHGFFLPVAIEEAEEEGDSGEEEGEGELYSSTGNLSLDMSEFGTDEASHHRRSMPDLLHLLQGPGTLSSSSSSAGSSSLGLGSGLGAAAGPADQWRAAFLQDGHQQYMTAGAVSDGGPPPYPLLEVAGAGVGAGVGAGLGPEARLGPGLLVSPRGAAAAAAAAAGVAELEAMMPFIHTMMLQNAGQTGGGGGGGGEGGGAGGGGVVDAGNGLVPQTRTSAGVGGGAWQAVSPSISAGGSSNSIGPNSGRSHRINSRRNSVDMERDSSLEVSPFAEAGATDSTAAAARGFVAFSQSPLQQRQQQQQQDHQHHQQHHHQHHQQQQHHHHHQQQQQQQRLLQQQLQEEHWKLLGKQENVSVARRTGAAAAPLPAQAPPSEAAAVAPPAAADSSSGIGGQRLPFELVPNMVFSKTGPVMAIATPEGQAPVRSNAHDQSGLPVPRPSSGGNISRSSSTSSNGRGGRVDNAPSGASPASKGAGDGPWKKIRDGKAQVTNEKGKGFGYRHAREKSLSFLHQSSPVLIPGGLASMSLEEELSLHLARSSFDTLSIPGGEGGQKGASWKDGAADWEDRGFSSMHGGRPTGMAARPRMKLGEHAKGRSRPHSWHAHPILESPSTKEKSKGLLKRIWKSFTAGSDSNSPTAAAAAAAAARIDSSMHHSRRPSGPPSAPPAPRGSGHALPPRNKHHHSTSLGASEEQIWGARNAAAHMPNRVIMLHSAPAATFMEDASQAVNWLEAKAGGGSSHVGHPLAPSDRGCQSMGGGRIWKGPAADTNAHAAGAAANSTLLEGGVEHGASNATVYIPHGVPPSVLEAYMRLRAVRGDVKIIGDEDLKS